MSKCKQCDEVGGYTCAPHDCPNINSIKPEAMFKKMVSDLVNWHSPLPTDAHTKLVDDIMKHVAPLLKASRTQTIDSLIEKLDELPKQNWVKREGDAEWQNYLNHSDVKAILLEARKGGLERNSDEK